MFVKFYYEFGCIFKPFDCETIVKRGFRGCPLDGELGALLGVVNALLELLDDAGQAEVRDFHYIVVPDQDVTSG